MKKMLGVVLTWVVLCQMLSIATAQDKEPPEKIVERRVDAVLAVLQQDELDLQAKKDKIIEIVSPMFDFQLMAKLSLGRDHWTRLSEQDRERFTELFITRLKESYLNKMVLYTDEKIIYEPPIQEERKAHIPTFIVAKDSKTSMQYKLYESKAGWKLYDIEIEGVSVIQTYRSQFVQILESGTINDLLLKLEIPVDTPTMSSSEQLH